MQKKAVNHLNIANEPRKMPNLHNHDFIAYVEHTKKSPSNKEDTSTISRNLSGSLSKTRIFIGDGSICEDSTWQQSPNHLSFLPLHYEVKSRHHAKFQLFLTSFTFSNFSTTEKSIFDVVPHNYLAYFPAYFSWTRHPHVEKIIRENFLTIFIH